jgi:hypothetical protein
LKIGTTEIAFSEWERNLVAPASFPLFGVPRREDPAPGRGGGSWHFRRFQGISTAGDFR